MAREVKGKSGDSCTTDTKSKRFQVQMTGKA